MKRAIPTNKRADEEARLAYALIAGLSFDDGLAMIQSMFRTDEIGACDLIVRGKRLADGVAAVRGRVA